MKARFLPCLALLASCTFSGRVGCSTGGELTQPPTAPVVTQEAAWTAKRYVALLEDPSACVAVEGWDASPMFGKAMTLTDPRGKFCVYSWNGSGTPVAAPTVAKLVRMDADRDVVVPQAPVPSNPSKELRRDQAKRVREALGAGIPSNARAPADWLYAAPAGAKAPPYVAVVDTANDSEPGDSTSEYYATDAAQHHGLMMRGLVDAVRCPYGSSECADRQFFVQAMPYDADHHTPQDDGGRRGSLGSLAVAIDQAVERWKAFPDADRADLIINLSVGWDVQRRDIAAGDPQALLAAPDVAVGSDVQAIYVALARARCEGALVIAASGNHLGQPCREQGPMGPGAWERFAAPSDCSVFGIDEKATGQLVYAVGGLDEYDQPIANSRIGSLPRRALYSHKAVLAVGDERFTQPWTGTSVATASLSAIAASLWSHEPGLSVEQLMARIDDSGVVLPLAASILPKGMVEATVRRIDAQTVLGGRADNPYLVRPALGSTELRAAIESSTRVTLYTEPGYEGTSQVLGPGEYSLAEMKIGVETVSSLRIPPGISVTMEIRVEEGLRDSLVLNADTPTLEVHMLENGEQTFDDLVSHVVIALEAGERPICEGADTSPLEDVVVETLPQPHVPACPSCKIVLTGSGTRSAIGGVGTYTVEWAFDRTDGSTPLTKQTALLGTITFTALQVKGVPMSETFSIDSDQGTHVLGAALAKQLHANPEVRSGAFTVEDASAKAPAQSVGVSIGGNDVIQIEN